MKFCQKIIPLCLPPMISIHFHRHCVLPLNGGQFTIWKVLPIESYGVVGPIVTYIFFPEYPSASSLYSNIFTINVFWFLLFHGSKSSQFSNIKRSTSPIYFPRVYPVIYNLSIFPDNFLTTFCYLYLCDFILLYSSLLTYPYFLPKKPYPSFLLSLWISLWMFPNYVPGLLLNPE